MVFEDCLKSEMNKKSRDVGELMDWDMERLSTLTKAGDGRVDIDLRRRGGGWVGRRIPWILE
jgi:hypothetical protein